ncbi:MAG: alpha/beta fold hydrolase [Ferrimicrobium sp.]
MRGLVVGYGGAVLSVDIFGQGQRCIMLLHGLGSRSSFMTPLAVALADRGFRVVVPDLRGHGDSEFASLDESEVTLPILAEDLHRVCLSECQLPVYVVAWSLGAAVLGEYLRHYGEGDIAGAALLGPALSVADDAARQSTQRGFSRAVRALMELDIDLGERRQRAREFVGCITAGATKGAEFGDAIDAALAVPPKAYQSLLSLAADYRDEFARLAKSRPLGIIHAVDDEVISLDASRTYAESIPSVILFTAAGGHARFHSCPDAVAEEVLEIFGR